MDDEAGIRIVLADERGLFREAAQAALEAEHELEIVGTASDAFSAVEQASACSPDVVILSDELAGASIASTVAELIDRAPGCRVLILLGTEQPPVHLVRLLQAGARGFLTIDAPLSDLVTAVRDVHAGELALSGRLATAVIDDLIVGYRAREAALAQISQLTARERQVLTILARGGSNATIADELVISTQTVRTHVSHLLRKLGVHSRLEAVALVVRHGLLDHLETSG